MAGASGDKAVASRTAYAMNDGTKAALGKVGVGIYVLLVAAGVAVSASTLLGFAGRYWWAFDLLSHFQVQYLLGISAVIVLLILARRPRAAVLFVLCAAVNLYLIAPYYVSGAQANSATSPAFRALTLNVNSANTNYDLVAQLVRNNNLDIVLLTEVTPEWARALAELDAGYAYRKGEPREDTFGIVLYSKLPLHECSVVYLGAARAPSITAEIEVGGERVALVGTHPLPPVSNEYSRFRNDQILALANHLRATPGPKILLGDLNTSPWSYWFRRLVGETGLKDSSLGRGIRPTWPTDSILFRIPLDYCLVSEGIVVKDCRIGPNIGSDHFPLIVDLALRR